MGSCLQAFLRQRSREYESPSKNNDCEGSSLSDSQKTIADQKEEDEPISAKEKKQRKENNVFKTRRYITVEEKRIREWEEQKNCDIEITYGEFRTNAHNEVLSNVSDYFKANFEFNKHERNVSLQEEFVFPDSLRDIIHFAYTGILVINTDRLEDVIATASYLQVKFIVDECEKGLINNIDDSSFISVLAFAIRFDLSNLIDAVILCLSENFETLVGQNALCSLSHHELKFLLMNENLSVFRKGIPVDNPELHILDAIGKTLTANQVDDKAYVEDILSVIRFSEIPKRNLSNLYYNYPAFQALSESDFFSYLENKVLPKRTFSKSIKDLENSKACAKNPHRKLPDQFKLVRYFEDILDINDRPIKIGLWITRWEGYIDIGGIQIKYKSGKSVLHGVRPTARHSILSEHEFELDEDEVITNINLRAGILLNSISFDTNYGRTYGPYGSNGGYPSSSSPSQKRGYFHSFQGIVVKGRYDHYIANIECAWVVFKTDKADYNISSSKSSKPKDFFSIIRFRGDTEWDNTSLDSLGSVDA
ncbi:KLHL1_4_5 [Mytilus edulis]|uniref:KLHL1_4_5 n=1 Tax=Mytilus edulis TaxID=6550 RepID=A0A8S3QL36_MYTED|nr:KLHL1_4_5 [Mytilus edulis]